MKQSLLSIAITLALCPFKASLAASPMLMQAKNFNPEQFEIQTIQTSKGAHTGAEQNDISDYFISEKLDGIRAYWTGNSLLTRSGQIIAAPIWFTSPLPDTPLDGELWIARGKFQQVASTVLDHSPNDHDWQSIRYMVFDLPANKTPFHHRYQQLIQHINQLQQPHIQIIKQQRITDLTELDQRLKQVASSHGEGLMLHHRTNYYQAGRTSQLLKLKMYQDAEATVIGYEGGNGKFSGKMGAIWVVTTDGLKFKIGSGFNLYDRENPPALGTTINYRFNGFTDSGIPRFARFIRTRNNIDI